MSQPKSNKGLDWVLTLANSTNPKDKELLLAKVRVALAQKDAEVAKAQSKALVPLCFLQAELTTLLLERNTYNREDKIQENLETIVATVEELREALTPKE